MVISSCSSFNLLFSPLAPTSKYQSGLLPPFSASRSSNRSLKKAPSLHCHAQLLSDLAPATAATYGALLIGGGVFAYVRSGSKGSVIGGLSGAALMGTAYYLMQSPETKVIGDALGFGSAFLFSAVFGIRLAATRKLIPSGFLLALSLGSLGVFLSYYFHDKI
ncbi:TMEM14 family protein [Dioscorea alata]|uniref:TMEM14 family protein n=1 Tax=Dioscorea alata TaxID=55571 RepID=A0ACB7WDH3_DIOAL|nr:TMEM14 family protein [Dioscorea alata]